MSSLEEREFLNGVSSDFHVNPRELIRLQNRIVRRLCSYLVLKSDVLESLAAYERLLPGGCYSLEEVSLDFRFVLGSDGVTSSEFTSRQLSPIILFTARLL